jgi:hypothetical protein
MKNVTPIEQKKKYPIRREHGMAANVDEELDRRKRISETKATRLEQRKQRALVLVDHLDAVKDEEEAELAPQRRPKFHELRPHQERAAVYIAAGGTIAMAGEAAGVSGRQVRKYLQDPNFRDRIIELRQIVLSEMQGKIMQELLARLTPEKIAKMEVMDLLRIYDRSVGGKDKGLEDGASVQKYDQVFNNIILLANQSGSPNSSDQSADFPEYGPEDLLLPGGDSQGD